ncbi:MAG: phosphotransferase [Pseudomonadota bacterium]
MRAPYNRPVNEHLKQWLSDQLPAAAAPSSAGRPPAAEERDGGRQSGGFETTPLLVEASQRHFYRIALDLRSLVLMASPPELERNDAFVALSRVLGGAGIPVPEIYAQDLEHGYFLMQDLGAQALREHYGTAQESAAVGAAISLLPQLQAVRSELIPPYTRARLADELTIFTDWFLEQMLGIAPPDFLAATFRQLIDSAATQPQVCVHRDYHCRNLLWNDGTLGVVDFQDALHGPYTYDLASLLHDCYYQWPGATRARYRDQGRVLIAPTAEPAAFRQQLEWMAVQRQLKAIGIFVRLKLRDARGSHLEHVLPTLEQTIGLSASYPELEALGHWLETLLPAVRLELAELARE